MELNDEILTIQELAERLKVKKSTIYDLMRNRGRVRAENRSLPCIKVGKQFSNLSSSEWRTSSSPSHSRLCLNRCFLAKLSIVRI